MATVAVVTAAEKRFLIKQTRVWFLGTSLCVLNFQLVNIGKQLAALLFQEPGS